MKFFYLQLQSSRHICPHTSIVDENFLSTILKKAWWWCRPPWWGCWPSWWGCWPPWWWCRPPWGWWGPQKHCCGVIKDDCCTEGRPEIGNPKVWGHMEEADHQGLHPPHEGEHCLALWKNSHLSRRHLGGGCGLKADLVLPECTLNVTVA